MEEIYERIVSALAKAGGYILLNGNNRPTIIVDDDRVNTIQSTKKALDIKSIVWVCEYEDENGRGVCEVKLIDTNDEMWDLLDYVTDKYHMEMIERHITLNK